MDLTWMTVLKYGCMAGVGLAVAIMSFRLIPLILGVIWAVIVLIGETVKTIAVDIIWKPIKKVLTGKKINQGD